MSTPPIDEWGSVTSASPPLPRYLPAASKRRRCSQSLAYGARVCLCVWYAAFSSRCSPWAFEGASSLVGPARAKKLEPQTIYAIEDAEEVRLVDDLCEEDGLPVFGLQHQPFEGSRLALTELAWHH
jgi:hypothetical protein